MSVIVPKAVLKAVAKFVTRMPEDAAEVTIQFLSSRRGVEQAL